MRYLLLSLFLAGCSFWNLGIGTNTIPAVVVKKCDNAARHAGRFTINPVGLIMCDGAEPINHCLCWITTGGVK
jgi:hypothetical protein